MRIVKTRVRPTVTPPASSLKARERMIRQLQRDTKPELAVRRAVHALGLRYRVNRVPVEGMRSKVDLVFPTERVAVFIDGCFWHGCPEHGTWPKSNAQWWRNKIEGNRERDRRTDQRLEEMDWRVVRVWAHENAQEAAMRIREIVENARRATGQRPMQVRKRT